MDKLKTVIDKIKTKQDYKVTTSMIQQFKGENDEFPWPELESLVAEKLEILANDGIRIADDDKAVRKAEKELFYRIC